MNVLQVLVLSIVEGLTEFLPISSTGHLILVQKYLGVVSTSFTKTFDIVIQLAAILAVALIYSKRLVSSVSTWKQSLIAFIPTGIIGLTLYKLIKDTLLEQPMITVYALFLGGLVLLFVDQLKKINSGQKSFLELKIPELLKIGLFQSLSIIPGVSRSAAAVIGGLASGLTRSQAVEFSFILAIPTMVAASGYDLLKSGLAFTAREYLLLGIGCLFSFIAATLSVKFFIQYVKKNDFTIFAIYRIILAVVVFLTLKK